MPSILKIRRDWSIQSESWEYPFLGGLQSLRMEGSNLSEFSGYFLFLSEFQNEGGSNLSKIWILKLKMLTYIKI